MKHWQVLGKTKELENKRTDQRQNEIIKILLQNRGLTTKREIEEFLNPPRPYAITPSVLGIKPAEITKAVKRIEKAIKLGEQLVVYGDYDADGICGTAILWETLHHLGAKVLPYIPHRVEEGYGLSQKGIDNLLAHTPYTIHHKPSLIITVDHGITAQEEVDYAKGKGVDVLITDHHQKPKKLPQSYATIWTDKLSGAGVAWILAKELVMKQSSSETMVYLDLVSLATIADLSPLTGANRTLVKFGLEELNKTQRPGLLALLAEAGLTLGEIGTYEVGFILASRLNAAGRIEHALNSLRLLCTHDSDRARKLAQKLNQVNQERQRLTEEAFLHARSLVQEKTNLIFISHSSYNEGIIGLVAGKLTEEFWRPSIVVSEGKAYSKASARSINGFNIIEAIRRFEEILVDCGGHPMAAGFTVETTKLAEVKNRLLEIAEKEIKQEQLQKTLKIDCEIELTDINWPLYDELSKFEPFGIGNPEPVFLTRQVKVENLRLVGNDGKHLKLTIQNPTPYTLHPTPSFSAIGFGLGEWGQKLKIGDQVDLVYTLLTDSWNGQERLQLKIKDLKVSP